MAQFPLKMNGTEVCTLEDLKKSFKPDELISYRSRFAAWLKGWDYDEEAGAARALGQNLSDEEWLEAVCKIIGISEEELKAIRKNEEAVAVAKQAEENKKKQEFSEAQIKQELDADRKKDKKINLKYKNNREALTFKSVKDIKIERLKETNKSLPVFCNEGEDNTIFIADENEWFFSPEGKNLFKSDDYGNTWTAVIYPGNRIFYCNKHWVTSRGGDIKKSNNLSKWLALPGPNLKEGDRIFFDGEYYAILKKLRDGSSDIWISSDFENWEKIWHFKTQQCSDAIFCDKCYLLEEVYHGKRLYQAETIHQLWAYLQSRNCRSITQIDIEHFIGKVGETFILTTNEDLCFWLTDDLRNFTRCDGTVCPIENFMIRYSKNKFYLSKNGLLDTWYEIKNMIPPFPIHKLAYHNGLLLMYGLDFDSEKSRICVANVYAKGKDEVDKK